METVVSLGGGRNVDDQNIERSERRKFFLKWSERRKIRTSKDQNVENQNVEKNVESKPGGLDLSRRDLDRDLDLDVQKISVSTVEKISTVFKS